MNQTIREDFEKAKAVIKGLPQLKQLTQEQVVTWFKTVLTIDPERILWHATRLNGVGGSEIGPIARFFRELKADATATTVKDEFGFGSVQDVFKHKLMQLQIIRPNSDMLRGIRLEPIAREAYIEELRNSGHIVEIDVEAIEALEAYRDDQYPWLRYSPDDVLLIDGVRVLIDYKCPDESPLSTAVYFDYEAQLNHGAILLERAGYPVDSAKLVKYQGMTCEIKSITVPLLIQDEILEAGDWFWNQHVMVGKPTPYKPPELPSISAKDITNLLKDGALKTGAEAKELLSIESHINTLREAALKYGQLQIFSKSISSQSDGLAKEVTSIQKELSKLAPGVCYKHEIGPTVVTTKERLVIDETALISFAESKEIDLTKYRKSKLDLAALYADIRDSLSEEESSQISSTEQVFSAAISRKTTGPTAEVVNTMRGASNILATTINEEILSKLSASNSIVDVQEQFIQDKAKYQAWAEENWQDAVSQLREQLVERNLELPDEIDIDDLLPVMTP